MTYVYLVWLDDSKFRESGVHSIWSTLDSAEAALSIARSDETWEGYSFFIRTIGLDPDWIFKDAEVETT